MTLDELSALLTPILPCLHPSIQQEEAVLAAWLVEKLESPGPPPASFYLPLLAASRWRAPESLAAFKRWADVVGAGTSTTPGAAAAISLIDAIINAQVCGS